MGLSRDTRSLKYIFYMFLVAVATEYKGKPKHRGNPLIKSFATIDKVGGFFIKIRSVSYGKRKGFRKIYYWFFDNTL